MADALSALTFLNPIIVFAFVFVILFAILAKTKILGSAGVNAVVSFVIAFIFATLSPAREYITNVTPWFAVLFVVIFFVLLIIGFTQEKISSIMKPGITWVFIILLAIILIVVALNVFQTQIAPYTPGGNETGGNSMLLSFKHIFISNEVLTALLLLVVAAAAAWVVTKK